MSETDSLIVQADKFSAKQIEPVHRMVGAKIAHMRETLGWTQDELANKIGCSRPSIANIEVGRQRMQLHDIEAFCLIFMTTPQHFMRGIWWQDGRKK